MKFGLGMYCYDKVNRKLGIGEIVEVRQNNNHVNYVVEYKNHNALISSENIMASYDITDLIEIGDYVNGSRVEEVHCNLEYIDDDADTGVNETDDGIMTEKEFIYFVSDIRTIVTKEQFENNCYKVERGVD